MSKELNEEDSYIIMLEKLTDEMVDENKRLNNIIETTKIFVEKYNDKPFDIKVREMILKCLNDEVKGSDKE